MLRPQQKVSVLLMLRADKAYVRNGRGVGLISPRTVSLFCPLRSDSDPVLALGAEGQGPTAEQQMQLQRLMQSLKQIEEQQKELQAAIQTAKAERDDMLKKDRDFYDPKAKEPPAPKMEVSALQADTIEVQYLRMMHNVSFSIALHDEHYVSPSYTVKTVYWCAGAERQQPVELG